MLKLTIVTPERKVVGPVEVESVTVPGAMGEMTILPGHAQLVSLMDTGLLAFERQAGKKEIAAVSAGLLNVSNDKVTVLAETLEMSQEIDVDRARRAQSKAEEKLKALETFEEDMQKWQRKLRRSLIRQQVAEYLLPPH